MSLLQNHKSNLHKQENSSSSIKLSQEKTLNLERKDKNLSIHNRKLDEIDNANWRTPQENLLILNYLINASEKNSSEKTALTETSPENFEYDLTMLNKFEEDFNTSLDFISDFDLEKDDNKSFSSFDSENDNDSLEEIEIKTKHSKRVGEYKNSDDEFNDKLNQDFIDIKKLLLSKNM